MNNTFKTVLVIILSYLVHLYYVLKSLVCPYWNYQAKSVTYTVKNKRPPWHFKKIVKRKFVVQCLCGIFLHHNLVKTERHGATWKCRPGLQICRGGLFKLSWHFHNLYKMACSHLFILYIPCLTSWHMKMAPRHDEI